MRRSIMLLRAMSFEFKVAGVNQRHIPVIYRNIILNRKSISHVVHGPLPKYINFSQKNCVHFVTSRMYVLFAHTGNTAGNYHTSLAVRIR